MMKNAAPDVFKKKKKKSNPTKPKTPQHKERSRKPLRHNNFSMIKIKNFIWILIIVYVFFGSTLIFWIPY